MTEIHPTAIVDPRAELGEGVTVGPYSIIGPNVRLGDGCRVGSMVLLDGWTEVGAGCSFFHGAVVGTQPQDLKYKGVRSYVRIGSNCTFREFCTVNRATAEEGETRIGDGCLVMAYAHVAHECKLGKGVILANSANLAGHVELDDYVIIGGVTPVHQFVKIGTMTMIGGGCRVPKDVPPYVRAAGHPLRVAGLNTVGLERHGVTQETMAELKKVYRIFFRMGLTKEDAAKKIEEECKPLPEVRIFLEFIGRSERGLTR